MGARRCRREERRRRSKATRPTKCCGSVVWLSSLNGCSSISVDIFRDLLDPNSRGHVLVIPRRVVARYKDLREDEIADLWVSAQKIANVIEREYSAEAVTFAIQDGKAAGQTVPHVHVHILPRRGGDFKRNDEVYTHLEKAEEQRVKRTLEDMAEEASRLAKHFTHVDP